MRTHKLLAAALFTVLFSQLVQAQSPVAGWASATNYRNADTAIRRAIVTGANNDAGRSSGSSNVLASNGSKVWMVDTDGGDGGRMRSAISLYAGWKTNPAGKTLTQIKTSMKAAFSASSYDSTSQDKIVDQIVARYNAAPQSVTTDQATLNFLQIRRQCLEYIDSKSSAAGGGLRNYSSGSVNDQKNFRPGMGLFRIDQSHAAIIVDIYWNAAGTPTSFKLAEANYGNGFTNPVGQVPWERTVAVGRTVSLTGFRVVAFD